MYIKVDKTESSISSGPAFECVVLTAEGRVIKEFPALNFHIPYITPTSRTKMPTKRYSS
jgi:hypothetical protein